MSSDIGSMVVGKDNVIQTHIDELYSFLEKCKVKKGEPSTHTTVSPSGNYNIDEDVYETFITIYCNAIRKGVRPTITERPGIYGPLRADFDLKTSLAPR